MRFPAAQVRWTVLASCCVGPACSAAPSPEVQNPATVVSVPVADDIPPRAPVVEPAPLAGDVSSGTSLELGGLRPGIHVDELRRILGKEDSAESFESSRTGWQEQGYALAAQIEFIVGFDSVLVFNSHTPTTRLPVWSVYVKDQRAALLKFTMFVPGTEPVEHVGFPPACFLTGDPSGIARTFGPAIVVDDAQRGSSSHHYLDRGLTVVVKDNQIAVFDLYEPMVGARRDEVERALLTK